MTNDSLSGLECALAPPIAATRLFAVTYCRTVEEGTANFFANLLLHLSWNLRRWLPAQRVARLLWEFDSPWILGDVLTAAFDERLSFRLLRPFEYLAVPFFLPPLPSYSSPCAFYFRTADDNHFRRFIIVFLRIVLIPKNTNRFTWSQRPITFFRLAWSFYNNKEKQFF